MHPIAATTWRPTSAVLLIIGLLLVYAGMLATSMAAASEDDNISRVELLE